MPKNFKLKKNPYEEIMKDKEIMPKSTPISSLKDKCPYCGSSHINPLKTVDTDGFQQHRCSSCNKTFGKKI
jgi:transposase-like protein